MENSGIQYDEQGRPYVLDQKGKRNYISPAAFGQAPPEDNSGFWHSKPQWNQNGGEWETPFDWGKAVTLATGGALGAGAASALGAFGAGGGAAGSAAPSSAYIGSDVAGTAAAAGGGGSALAGGLPSWLGAVAKPVGALAGGLLARNAGQSNGSNPLTPELNAGYQELLKLATDRAKRTEPVHQAAMNLAMQLSQGTGNGANIRQAANQAQQPRGQSPMDPQVLQAIAALMGRG